MDQSHAAGISSWDPNNFAGEAWDHQFGSAGLPFNQGADGDSNYPNPDFLNGGAINPQLSGGDHEAGLYRGFDYYSQGDVWPDHAQTSAATFAPDPSLQPGFFAEQQHPTNANQAADGRYALEIHQQGNDFPAQLHSSASGQAESHHPFGHGVTNPVNSTPNGYSQGAISQWQEQVPTGYGAGHQFENPLTAAHTSNLSAPGSNASPAAFFPSASAMPGYQTDVHRQSPSTRPAQPHFSAALNGQSQQPVGVADSPRVPAKPLARKVAPQQFSQQTPLQSPQPATQRPVPQQQPVEQPVQRPILPPVHQLSQQPPLQSALQPSPRPAPQPALQPNIGHRLPSQKPIPLAQSAQQPSENNVAAGVKRNPTAEAQGAPAAAKRAKVVAQAPILIPPPAQTHSQTVSDSSTIQSAVAAQTPSQPGPASLCSISHKDEALLASARGRPEARWKGVPNLVIASAPVKLQKGTPTKRYVTLTTKGGKDPLFPKAWRAWIPAECLGNHADAYQKASSDVDRQRADIRLDIDMKRAAGEVPADWWRKTLRDRLGVAPQQLGPPAEPDLSSIKAAEIVRLHPSHLTNRQVASQACSEFADFLREKAGEAKVALTDLADAQKKAKVDRAEVDSLTGKAELAKQQLERAITEGLGAEPGSLLANLNGQNKLVAVMNNVLIKQVNANQASSSLTKAILRLYTRLARFTPEQLEKLQMGRVRKKLDKDGDAEAKALMSLVYEKAEQKDDDESESEDDSPGPGAGGRPKKVASRAPSKQTVQGGESKRTTTASTTKPVTSTNDSAKFSSAGTTSKIMTSSNALSKTAPKAVQKTPLAATGVKRFREDDAAGAEARSSKKPATDGPSSIGAKPSLPLGKPPSAKPSTGTAASGSTGSLTKLRGFLPGKVREVPKPALKPDSVKAEAQKVGTKLELAKPQSTIPPLLASGSGAAKTAKPKTSEPTKQAPATRSAFSMLMDEIVEEKTIRTPTVDKTKANGPDPNETPEERERRLRKEKRRGLRVAFKSGDALVEIREFTRHPDEIVEGNTGRNASTDGRYKNSEESEMMKRLHGGQGIKTFEVNDREWEEPTIVNFASHIPQEKREQTYITRGGLKTFETEEQKIIRERESNELMVIYHNRADIPPSARSPPYEPSLSGSSGSHEVYLPPTVPEYNEMIQRGREFGQWGPYGASRAAQMRLDGKGRPEFNGHALRQPEVRPQPPVLNPAPQDLRTWYEPTAAARRDQQTYELLTSDRARNWQDSDPNNLTYRRKTEEELDNDPKLQKILASLRKIAEQVQAEAALRDQAKPAPEVAPTPQPAQPEAPQPAAVAAQDAQAAAPDYSAAWAQYYAAQQQHQQQQQAWYGQQQQHPYAQAANPYMQAQHASQAAAQQPQPGDQNNQYAGIFAALGIQQPTAAQPQAAHPTADQNAQIQAALMALAAGTTTAQGQAAAPVPAATDPQSAQYLLDVMKLAAAGGGGQAQAQPAAAAAAAHNAYQQYYSQAAAAAGAQGYGSAAEGYGPGQGGYGQPQHQHQQERETPYGQQMYGDRDREQQQQRDSGGGYRDRDRDWDRDRGDGRDHHRGGFGKGGGRGGGSGSGGGGDNNVPEHLRGIKSSLIGTKPCAFYAKGQCAKGDKCTFRHC
ncbi:hypothetical protein N658DRAFT_184337 [Parathielavia hyrcaniae]|uniref:C3H1-type domain-containing protein n=1 Tax=Parathielavia hyrcaniae TaxID=113614 RepID=A0AAN6QAB7_9PEZI|nr:hypothetical protein N658DRAFT_184337 [Parathielavia hyrcaniae]